MAHGEEPSYLAFSRSNVSGGHYTSPQLVKALLERIDRDAAALKAAQRPDYSELKTLAEKQSAAYARMCEIGEGIGGLGVRHPEMYDDMGEWQDLTTNNHADIVLALIEGKPVL